MSAIYSLGAIVVLPFVPWVSDRLGRRWAIVFGSILMVIGAALQTASQNCELKILATVLEITQGIQLPCLSVHALSWVSGFRLPSSLPLHLSEVSRKLFSTEMCIHT